MNVLVCGGAGYIGSHTVYELIERGHSVVVVDSLIKGHKAAVHNDAKFYLGDIRDEEFMDKVFKENNIDAVLQVMQFIYDNIMYAELNTKSDYCECCGYNGEIQIINDEKTGKLVWECPNCGNRNQDKMSVARRTCGYIGTQFWNQGRTQEIKDRVLHL